MPVIERAGREQDEGDQAGKRSAHPPCDAPAQRNPDETDGATREPARLEQIEGQDLGEQRRQHVEAAAIGVEIDERERALVEEAGREELHQQLAVLRVGVVVPAEAVIPEGQRRDDR